MTIKLPGWFGGRGRRESLRGSGHRGAKPRPAMGDRAAVGEGHSRSAEIEELSPGSGRRGSGEGRRAAGPETVDLGAVVEGQDQQ
jgi:hypothetical protein